MNTKNIKIKIKTYNIIKQIIIKTKKKNWTNPKKFNQKKIIIL